MGRPRVGRTRHGPGHRRGRQKRGLQASFQATLLQEIEKLIGRPAPEGLDLEALETAAKRCALRLAAQAIEAHLNQDHSDYSGPQQSCECGGPARYAGRRSKSFQSVLGPLRLERAYYHCAACEGGFFPRDRALGLEPASLSPGVSRMVALVGAMVSFREGHQLLQQLAGVTLNPKRVERSAEALGAALAEDEKQHAAPLDSSPPPPTLYLGLDGTGIPMRPAELRGRAGKQPDGSAKTREVKLCVIWSAESRDDDGRPKRDEGSVSYTAALESAASPDSAPQRSEFRERVLREIQRRQFFDAPRTAVVADLAPWIWNTTQELSPRSIPVADRFHVKERFSGIGKAVYGAGSEQAKQWTARRYEELDAGRFAELLRAVGRHTERCEEARKGAAYLETHRAKMRYPEFEQQGLCTSSGVIEAGCKNVIGTRLKRGGMHWTEAGANAIIALRCSILSGRFEDFCERHFRPPTPP